MYTWKQYLYEGKEKPCGLDFDCPEDPSTYLLFPWLICRPSASKRFKPLRLMTFDLGDIWSRNRWCELAWTFEKNIPQILREEPLSARNSHEHSAQSATLWFFHIFPMLTSHAQLRGYVGRSGGFLMVSGWVVFGTTRLQG